MRKWIIAGGMLAARAGTLAVALLNLNSYLERNQDRLTSQVQTALGRPVSFDEVRVSVLGGLGATVSNLRIGDDPKFNRGDFLQARRVLVTVKFFPLLRGRIEMGRVLLDHPTIAIVRKRDAFNFSSLGGTTQGSAERKGSDGSGDDGTGNATATLAGLPFLVSNARIVGAEIHYRDETATPTAEISVRDLDVSATHVGLDQPVRLELAAALNAARRNLQISGTVGPIGNPPDPSRVPFDIEAEIGPVVLDEIKAAQASLRNLALQAPDPIRLDATARGTLQECRLDVSLDATDSRIASGSLFRKPKGVPLRVTATGLRRAEVVDLESATVGLGQLELVARGRITTAASPLLDLQFDAKPASIEGIERLFPAGDGYTVTGRMETHIALKGRLRGKTLPAVGGTLALTDVAVHKKGSPLAVDGLTTTVRFAGDRATAETTEFAVAGQRVQAEASVSRLSAPTVAFALRSPELRLAALGLATADAAKAEVMRDLEVRGTLDTVPSFTAAGTLASARGAVRGVSYGSLAATWRLNGPRKATLERLNLEAFGGTYSGRGSYDANSGTPEFDSTSTVRNMQIADLLATWSPGTESKMRGSLDADLSLQGSGKSWEAMRQTLRGAGRAEVKDGVLQDVNIGEAVLTGLTGVEGLTSLVSTRVRKKYPEIFNTGDTAFDSLRGSVSIANQRLTTNDLTLGANDYKVLGRGFLQFDKRVDLDATLVASEKLTADVTADFKEARYLLGEDARLRIPFSVKGKLPSVRPQPDRRFVLETVKRALLEKGLDSLLGKPEPRQTPGEKDTTKKKGSPEQELLRKGIESLLGR